MVTMSQKSSVPQAAKSVSQALMSDNPGGLNEKDQATRIRSRHHLRGDTSIRTRNLFGPRR
jgi:hypothetical protein